MKCSGCGIKLQTTDILKDGYISEIHLIENGEQVYCKRCFDIIHYNSFYKPLDDNKIFFDKMQMIKKKYPHEIICLMLDATDLLGSFSSDIIKAIDNMKTIILINKIDLLPKSIKIAHFEEVVREKAIKQNINVFACIGISALTKTNVLDVLKKIDKLRYNKYTKKLYFNNAFVVGVASVGKSTFINSVKEILNINTLPITTSDQFQTTLDIIKVELGNKFFIVDTPGVVNTKSFKHYLKYDSVKKITPKKFLKVKTFQLNCGQTLFLGGLVRLDFLEGENITVSLFTSNDLYVHRTKLINADNLYESQILKLLAPPFDEEELENLGNTSSVTFSINDDEFHDLLISGIGLIHLKGKGVIINLTMSKKIAFKLESRII